MAQPTTFNAFIATTMAEIRRTVLEQFGSTIQPATNAYKLDMPYYNPESPDVFGPNIPHHLTILFATYNLLANASTAYNWLTWTITSQYPYIKGEDALEAHVKNGAAIADDNIIHRLLSYLELLGPVSNTFIPNIAANDDVVNMKQVFALLVAIGKNFSADMLSLPVKEKEIRQKISEMFPKMIAIGNIRLAECDFLSALRDYDEDKATANATAAANNSCADGDRCREIAAKYNNPVLNNTILKLRELKQLLHPPITDISNISPYTKEQMQRFDEVIKLLTTELTLLLSEKLTYPNWQFNSTTALAKIMSPIDAEETVESLGIKQTELSAFIKKCAEELVAVEAVESLIIAAGPNFEEVTSPHNLKFNISDRKIALAKDLAQAQQALEHIGIRKKETALLEPIKATLRCFMASNGLRIEGLMAAISNAECIDAFALLDQELETLTAVFKELKQHVDAYTRELSGVLFSISDIEIQRKQQFALLEDLARRIEIELPKAVRQRREIIQRRTDTTRLEENIRSLDEQVNICRKSLGADEKEVDESNQSKNQLQRMMDGNGQKIAAKNKEIEVVAQELGKLSKAVDAITKKLDALRMEQAYAFFNSQCPNYQGKDVSTLTREQEALNMEWSKADDAYKSLLATHQELIRARDILERQNAGFGSDIVRLQKSIHTRNEQNEQKRIALSQLEKELYLLMDKQAEQQEVERIKLQKEAEERAEREREQREAEERVRRESEQAQQLDCNANCPYDESSTNIPPSLRGVCDEAIQENSGLPHSLTLARNDERDDKHPPAKTRKKFAKSLFLVFGIILFCVSAGITTFGTGGLAPITIACVCFIIGGASFLSGSISIAAPDFFDVFDYFPSVYPVVKNAKGDGDAKNISGYPADSIIHGGHSPSLVDA